MLVIVLRLGGFLFLRNEKRLDAFRSSETYAAKVGINIQLTYPDILTFLPIFTLNLCFERNVYHRRNTNAHWKFWGSFIGRACR
jgi:hypothetical protein